MRLHTITTRQRRINVTIHSANDATRERMRSQQHETKGPSHYAGHDWHERRRSQRSIVQTQRAKMAGGENLTTKEDETREHPVKQLTTRTRADSSQGNVGLLQPDQFLAGRHNASDAANTHMRQRIVKFRWQQYATNAKRKDTLPKYASAGNQEKNHD